MSFSAAMTALSSALSGDTALQAFCTASFGKTVTVKSVYKQRVEINLGELPLIIMTRPTVKKTFQTGVRDGQHTVMMYCLFQQENRDTGAAQLIEFEEHIDDAIIKDVTLGGTVINALPIESVNDEGKNHPVYCSILSLDIKHRRLT